MDLFYRLLGFVAGINSGLSRVRINFVPLHYGLILVLGSVAFFSGIIGMSVASAAGPAITVSLDRVLAGSRPERTFVSVTGKLKPTSTLLEKAGGGAEAAETKWVPLVDRSGKRGLLVQLKTTPATATSGKPVEVTGWLCDLNPDLLETLQAKKGTVGGIQIDTSQVLREGSDPLSPLPLWIISLATGVPAGLLFLMLFSQNIVFRKVPLGAGIPLGDRLQKIDLRVTGSFTLNGWNRRFLDVYSSFAVGEAGELLFISNIDASSRLYGFTLHDRQGYWVLSMHPGSLQAPESGLLYLDFRARPALRLKYRPTGGGKLETAIASFGSEAERYIFLQHLYHG